MTSERSWAGRRSCERWESARTDTLLSWLGLVGVVKLGLLLGCWEACKTGPGLIHPHE